MPPPTGRAATGPQVRSVRRTTARVVVHRVDHRTATMQIDPDVMSIQRGLPSSEDDLVCEAPSLDDSDPHEERKPHSFTASVLARAVEASWCRTRWA
jgi:hypothetical protein